MRTTTPPWGPTGELVYERSYRLELPDGSPERWDDTVERVVTSNLALVSEHHHLPDEARRLTELFLRFAALPGGRHLRSGRHGDEQVFNCHAAGWDDRDLGAHFAFMLDQLMQGAGVGSNYSDRFLGRLPAVVSAPTVWITCDPRHPDRDALGPLLDAVRPAGSARPLRVVDSREGWACALAELIRAHTTPDPAPIAFDLTDVRPRGAAIRRLGGVASGPGTLARLLRGTTDVLRAVTGKRLDAPAAMTIDHLVAEAAAAGGLRRAARMSVKSWRDPGIDAFIDAKLSNGAHWSTNLSVEIDDEFVAAARGGDPHAVGVLHRIAAGMLRNGEPGLWNRQLANAFERGEVTTPNPCGEVALEPWEACTIGHVNLSAFGDDVEAIADAHRLMARFLIRSTLRTVAFEPQNEVLVRNRRIGVGHFGFHGWLVARGIRYSDSHRDMRTRETLAYLYDVTRAAADAYADELAVARPVKVTAVAPTGTVAKLAGASEGIQPLFGRHYLRRIRVPRGSAQAAVLSARGVHVEDDETVAGLSVAAFPVEDPLVSEARRRWGVASDGIVETADEVSLTDFLEVQAMYQECYSDNAVSATAHVSGTRWTVPALADTLLSYADRLKGTTVLVAGSWSQAPYERISRAEYEARRLPAQRARSACGSACD